MCKSFLPVALALGLSGGHLMAQTTDALAVELSPDGTAWARLHNTASHVDFGGEIVLKQDATARFYRLRHPAGTNSVSAVILDNATATAVLRLEASTDLQGWHCVPVSPEMIAQDGQILVVHDGPRKFYRLRHVAVREPEFIDLPRGVFDMGDESGAGREDEQPRHRLVISEFSMAHYLTTKALWDKVVAWGRENGYSDLPEGEARGSQHPVVSVSWFDVVKWCNARSEMERLKPCYYVDGKVYKEGLADDIRCEWRVDGYRLPSEAEWEYAARVGQQPALFPWGNQIDHAHANYQAQPADFAYDVNPTPGFHPAYECGAAPYTSPVGSFRGNAYKLFDMAGNAYEWCWDWYDPRYYEISPEQDPHGPEEGKFRVLRGGSWAATARDARCAARQGSFAPRKASTQLGFRLARSGQR